MLVFLLFDCQPNLVGDEIQLGFVVICLKSQFMLIINRKGIMRASSCLLDFLGSNKLVITINLLFNFLFEFFML